MSVEIQKMEAPTLYPSFPKLDPQPDMKVWIGCDLSPPLPPFPLVPSLFPGDRLFPLL